MMFFNRCGDTAVTEIGKQNYLAVHLPPLKLRLEVVTSKFMSKLQKISCTWADFEPSVEAEHNRRTAKWNPNRENCAIECNCVHSFQLRLQERDPIVAAKITAGSNLEQNLVQKTVQPTGKNLQNNPRHSEKIRTSAEQSKLSLSVQF